MPQVIAPYLAASLFNVGLASSIGGAIAAADVISTVVVAAGAVGVQALLAPRPDLPSLDGGSTTIQQPIPQRIYAVGEVRLAGATLFMAERDGGLYMINALCDVECDGGEQFYLHEDAVLLNGSNVTIGGADGRYKGACELRIAFGQTGVHPFSRFAADFPSESAQFYGTGVTLLFMYAGPFLQEEFLTRYPNGRPDPSVALRTARFWDPRDPAQSHSNPATWTYSRNVALAWLWYECFCPHGPQRDVATAVTPVLQSWKDAADACDEDVTTAESTTIKRYEINYWWKANEKRETVRGMFAAACDGNLYELPDGTIVLRVGKYVSSGITMTDDDIAGYRIQGDQAREDRVNELTVKFTSPDQNYGAVEADPIRDDAQITLDGEELSQPIDLWQVQELNQAKRLALVAWKRQNEKVRGKLFIRAETGLALLGERFFTVQSSRVSLLTNEVVEIVGYAYDLLSGQISVDFIRCDTTLYDYDPNDATYGDGATPIVATPVLDQQAIPDNLKAAPIDSTPAGVALSWDQPVGIAGSVLSYLKFMVQLRVADPVGSSPGPWISIPADAPTVDAGRLSVSLYPPTDDLYEVRVASIGSGGAFSDWSTPAFYITTAAGAILDDDGDALIDDAGLLIKDDA